MAIDSNDNFVVVWEGDLQSSAWGVYGAYFTAQGKSATTPPATWSETGPMLLNNTPNNRTSYMGSTTVDLYDSGPRVAMSAAGAFVVTWADFSSVATGYDVYAQQFAPAPRPSAAQFLVNQTTANWQVMPAVGVGSGGDFTIVWTSFGQDNAEDGYPQILDYGIYARMYNANGTPLGIQSNEYRVNATTLGNQVAPTVASNDPDDDSIVAWVGPDTTTAGTTAIYLRNIDPPVAAAVVAAPPVSHSVSVADTTVSVGASGTQATFTLTLSAAASYPIDVNYSTADGTAKAGVNYSSASGTVNFAPGQTSETIEVNVAGLSRSELANKSFLLNLTNPTNGTLARASATATISDIIPAPPPAFSVSDATVAVGTTASQAVFMVSLASPATQTVAVSYSTADGTATAASGAYTPASGTLTFTPGQVWQIVSVPVAGLTAGGLANQTFQLNLTSPVNIPISRQRHGEHSRFRSGCRGRAASLGRGCRRRGRFHGHAGPLHREPVGPLGQPGHDDLRHG